MATLESAYRGFWNWLVEWFRVPADPPAPPTVSAGESVDGFRPAPEFLSYLKTWFWIVLVIVDLALVVAYIGIAAACIAEDLWWLALLLLPIWIALIVVPDIVAYVAVRLRYDTTWFVMTDRSLRVRRGIWVIRETTITFENVQNLAVRRGPLERHFGIARLTVETAGAGANPHKGGPGGAENQGVIEGVKNADELKQRILARLERSRSAGLGDEEHAAAGWTAAHLTELRAIRDELRKL